MGGAELDCGRIEIDAPESTRKLKLFLESFKKIRFLVGKMDMAVTNLGIATGGGAAGWGRTSGGGETWAGRRPISFLVGAAPLALVGLAAEAGVVETQAVAATALGCPGGG